MMDDLLHEFGISWKPKDVEKWTRKELEPLRLAERCIRFLAEIGIPNLPDWTMRFGAATHGLVPLAEYAKVFVDKPIGTDEYSQPILGERFSKGVPTTMHAYVIIGFDYTNPICISDRKEIVSVLIKDTSQVFFSSSAWQFIVSLLYFQECRNALLSSTHYNAEDTANELESKIREIDPKAFGNPPRLWTTVIEEIRGNLL